MPKVNLQRDIHFDDAKFKVYEEAVERVNLGLADEQGKRFNAMAKELDIAPLRLLREAIEFFIEAYSIEPQPFIDASCIAHQRAAEAMHFAAQDMKQRHIGPTRQTAGEGEGYAPDRIHEHEVKE